MKNQGIPPLIALTMAFLAFILGLSWNLNRSTGIYVSVPAAMQTMPSPIEIPAPTEAAVSFPVNINTATKEELMTLPGIGEELAQRILDYRKAAVLFSAPEELINVKGIGTNQVELILDLITIGG